MAVPHSSLRVLITCRELSLRGGSQLYTRDVAYRLRQLGHRPVVFSPRLGEVAAEMRSGGVPVVDDLDLLDAPPDIIHGQHHLQAAAAILRFPETPALYVCHGWLPWQEAPPRFPSIRKYIAVSSLCHDRLVIEHGIPDADVEIMYNFVDLERFRPRSALPERPERALLFSNQATADNFTREVDVACASFDITLDVIGVGTGRAATDPENILGHYDLVFGRGRSALEAMAVGAAVVLCDVEGTGPCVDVNSFDRLRDLNFGLGALQPPVDRERLRAEIRRYDRHDAALVRDRVRSECGRDEAVARLVGLYEQALNDPPHSCAAETLTAAARYLAWLGPFTESVVCQEVDRGTRERAAKNDASWIEQLDAVRTDLRLAERTRVAFEHSLAEREKRLALLENDLKACGDQLALQNARVIAQEQELGPHKLQLEAQKLEIEAQNLELDRKGTELKAQKEVLAATSDALHQLQRSPFSRLRARLLQVGPLVRLYQFVTRRRKTPLQDLG